MKFLLALCLTIVALSGTRAGPNTICDKRTAIQSSTGKWAYPGYAERAVDDNVDPDEMKGGCTHTDKDDPNPWLLVDLGCAKNFNSVVIVSRNGNAYRLQKFMIQVSDTQSSTSEGIPNYVICAEHQEPLTGGRHVFPCETPVHARYVLIRFIKPLSIPAVDRFIHVCDVNVE